MFVEFILTIIFTSVLFLLNSNRKPKKFPPGPFRWPVIGNLLQLGSEPCKTLLGMRDTYGDLIGLQFGSRPTVVINDAKLMKEAFNMNALSGRPLIKHLGHPESGKMRGVLFTEGTQWMEQRRFILRTLRDFGFGKKSMETVIQEEVGDLIEILQKTAQEPIATSHRFNISVVNSLWTIVTGEKFAHDDPKSLKLIRHLTANASSNKFATIGIPFPWLTEIFPSFSGYNEHMGNFLPILKFIQDSIDVHKKTYQEGTNRDLIDCFIQEISKAPESSSFKGKSGDENLLFGVFDLFAAGAETTSTTLSWFCFLLAHNPKVQEKLSKTLTEIVGTTRTPCLADRANLPYHEAVIMEVMRFSAMVPFAIMHEAMEDVFLQGYNIPKGTMVLANQFGILHDPKVWGDPENFRPERFLSSDEKTVLRHEALIPFSVGKRVCLGESLARDELFLFSAGVLQRFKMEFDANEPTPKMGHSPHAMILAPAPHKIAFRDRYE